LRRWFSVLPDDASEGDAQANAFLPSEARAAHRIDRDANANTRHGIGTELFAHREKIEVTRRGSPFEPSPVPMGRAHRHYTRAVCASPQRMPQTSDCVAERSEFEPAVPTD